jgi:hypothetical protein
VIPSEYLVVSLLLSSLPLPLALPFLILTSRTVRILPLPLCRFLLSSLPLALPFPETGILLASIARQ